MALTAAVPPARRAYVTAGGIFVVALVAAYVFPQVDKANNPASTAPGLITYLGVGLAVLTLTALMLFAGLRGLLPRTAIFVAAAFGYNALIVLVKFALGPVALYKVNEGEGFWVLNGETGGFAFFGLAAIVATLYGAAFVLLFLFFRSDLHKRIGIPPRFENRFVILVVVMFVLAVTGAVTVIGALGFLEYLLAVLAVGPMVALALVAAIALCAVAFRESVDQALLIRNVAVLSTFAWVGLAFIAAYHVVWLVFALVLISIWPLKAVSVK